MSLDSVKVGFIPLVDAAIPIVAADLGFAAAENLEIELVREISWSNIRDRLVLGHLDAAHLLAPIAIATTLGLNGVKTPLAAPLALGLNGNAITVAPHLHEEILGLLEPGADPADAHATGRAFAALTRSRRARGDEPPTLGMTFPFSSHNYMLRLWLSAAGLDPDEDVRLAVVPPPYMVDALQHGHVEGFCVGAPWNSVAVELGLGCILHLGVDLVRRCPEKVLGMRGAWLDGRPETAARLIRACAAATAWIDAPANRAELADLLASRDRLHVDASIIRRTLEGRLPIGGAGGERVARDYSVFGQDGALRPDPRHAGWLHAQMVKWRQASEAFDSVAQARAVYRADVFDTAVGFEAPVAQPGDPLGLVLG